MAFSVLDTQGRLKTFQVPSAATVTTTGNIDDLDFSNADLIRMNNASLSTIRGLKAGYSGQVVRIVSIGAGEVWLSHQDTGSSAVNRLINFVTVGDTPLAAGSGTATLQYDGTTQRWRLIQHEQGEWITVTFNSGDFTKATGTITVDSADVKDHRFRLQGRTVQESMEIWPFSISSAADSSIRSAIPNSWTAAKRSTCQNMYNNAGGGYAMGASWISGSGQTYIGHYLNNFGGTTWAVATNTSELYLTMTYEIQ